MGKVNKDQFIKAFDDHSDEIFRYCMLRVRDKALAKDITQDAFMRTWEYIRKGKEIDNLRAFLYKTAKNLIIDSSRKKKEISLDKLLEEGFSPSVQFENDTDEKAKIKKALASLDDMEDKYREVILMRYVEDMNPGEIAKVLGESRNNVYVRIHRGLKTLKKELKNHE